MIEIESSAIPEYPAPYSKVPDAGAKIRVGVILDGTSLSVTERKLLEELRSTTFVDLAALAVRRATEVEWTPGVTVCARALIRSYDAMDERVYGERGVCDINASVSEVAFEDGVLFDCTGCADSELLVQLQRRRLDVLLALRPSAQMLHLSGAAQFGLWWLGPSARPFADSDLISGFRATAAADAPVCSVLWASTGDRPDPLPIGFGSTRLVSRISVRRNLRPLQPLQRNLWLMALRTLFLQGWAELQRRASEGANAPDIALQKKRDRRRIGIPTVAWGLAEMGFREVRHRLRYRKHTELWTVGIRRLRDAAGLLCDTDRYQWIRAPARHWYADPFVFCNDGDAYLFMEDFEEDRGRGRIVCTRIDANGSVGAPDPVLERPYHLSYPHVFRHGGEIFMIPETGSNNSVELYRAVSFPSKWELVRVLYKGPAFDTTVLFDNGSFWFFTSLSVDAGRHSSQLLLFCSDRVDGDWRMHPASPISNDSRFARGAGTIMRLGPTLVRPAQDCSWTYGGAVNFRRIESLTQSSYRESEYGMIGPEKIAGGLGVHTYNRSDSIEVIDARVLIPAN